MDLHFKKVRSGHIVYNRDKKKSHSHIRRPLTCIKLIKLLERYEKPHSPYLLESARRLLTKDEFNRLRERNKKERYININRGVKNVRI